MYHRSLWRIITVSFMVALFTFAIPLAANSNIQLKFDHNYTYSEMVSYLKAVSKAYPNITQLHKIGESYLGKDLLVLGITNHATGKDLEKPGYWIDGNLHSSEVFGAAICLKTIETLVAKYGNDPFITNLVDTRTIYIMPKLNPDGSDHYLTKPDGMRSSVRPHDSDSDGLLDEDPPEDLPGDRYITQIRVRDELGPMKTSPEDPRLLVPRKEDEKGEWRVYTEGIDNDKDGKFNEDGVGGLDINRNWPAYWQQEYVQSGSGPYALSEPETQAVAEFLHSHRNVSGILNYHMSGDFVFRPPCKPDFDPVTGEQLRFPPEDEAIYQVFGKKYSELINNQEVVVSYYSRNAPPPRYNALFGMFYDWGLTHYGAISWVPEVGRYPCDYDKDGRITEMERLKWNDTEMGGKIFVEWKSYNHPQLGKVEIGGFIGKLYNPTYKAYINLMCNPGPIYEDFLVKHTKWNLYLVSMSPHVKIIDIKTTPGDAGYYKIVASIQNQGFLPTHVTQYAISNKTAKTVKATISLKGANLVVGMEKVDLGHLPGISPAGRSRFARGQSSSSVKEVEWMVKTTGKAAPNVVIKAISEKGGTDTKKLTLKK